MWYLTIKNAVYYGINRPGGKNLTQVRFSKRNATYMLEKVYAKILVIIITVKDVVFIHHYVWNLLKKNSIVWVKLELLLITFTDYCFKVFFLSNSKDYKYAKIKLMILYFMWFIVQTQGHYIELIWKKKLTKNDLVLFDNAKYVKLSRRHTCRKNLLLKWRLMKFNSLKKEQCDIIFWYM